MAMAGAAFVNTPAHALDFAQCVGPSTVSAVDPAAAWETDRRVFVFDGSSNDGRVVRIVGDIVELTPELFPSLFRENGQYLEDVDSITVDAREIIVAMPIRLASGHVRLNGQRVSFKFAGLISFVREPRENGQSVQILAKELDMSQARAMPLVFSAVDSVNPQAPRWNAAGKPSRTVSLTSSTIIPQNRVNSPLQPDAYTKYLIGLTLDRQRPEGDWMSAYSTASGEAADLAYATAVTTSLQWPDATAMKLQRIFSLAPYDSAVREFTRQSIENFRGLFAQRSSKVAEAGLFRLEQAFSGNTDLFGLSSISVPMTSVAHRIELFEDKLRQLYGPDGNSGLMKLWDDIKIGAATATAVDAARVRELQTDNKKKTEEAEAIARNMTVKEEQLSTVEAAITGIDVQMANRETFLRQQFDKEQDEARQSGRTIAIAQAAATVGSIAFPAAAPFVAGASGLLAAQQALQEPDMDVATAITRVQDIAQRHVAIVELSVQIRKDWNVVKSDFGQAVDYVKRKGKLPEENKKRFDAWKAAATAVRANSEKLIKNLDRPGNPEKLQFSHEDAAKDGELLKLLGERNDKVKIQETLQNDLQSMRKDYDSRIAAILETEAVVAELLTLQISNDEERIRYMALSDWARRSLIRDLAKEASLLRRSLSYALGSRLDLPADITFMAEGDLVETYGDISDPTKLEKSLGDARTKRAATYGVLLSRAKTAYQGLRDENKWNVPTPILFSADVAASSGDPRFVRARKRFIEELNNEIAGAVAGVDSRTSIRIPFYPDAIGTTNGAVLLGVNIASVRFEGGKKPEGGLIFKVEHPRFGAMQRSESCEVVSDTPSASGDGTDILPVSWPTAVPADVTADWRKNISFANQLFKIQDAMFPFFAPYSMSVEVPLPREWTTPPRLEAIDIQFIVSRPN